jgi:hypothetical protein
MSGTLLPHLYAVWGDGRVNLYGSADAFRSLSGVLRLVSKSRMQKEIQVTRAETPHYGVSVRRLVLAAAPNNLGVVIDSETFSISANDVSLVAFADCLDRFASTWDENGHFHFSFCRDDTGWNGATLIMEVLIGGHGYLPNDHYGLADEY